MSLIPLSLNQSIESGKCVLFLGAGIGQHLVTHGKHLPNSWELSQELCKKFNIEAKDHYELPTVSKVVEIQKNRQDLENFLHTRFSDPQPDETLQWLLSLGWRSIYTTNYDEGIKRAFELNGDRKRNPIIYSLSRDIVDYDPRLNVPIIHLHGTLYGENKSEIVITDDDYTSYKEKRRMLFELLKKDAATSNILYIGYSNKDPNWNLLIKELRDEFSPNSLPSSYRVSPHTDELDQLVLEASGVATIETNLDGFVKELKKSISKLEDIDNISKYRDDIPLDFHTSFDVNPAATLSLFKTWDYVNQAPFDQEPNLNSFLKGDKANWALISKKGYFLRDIEEDIYDQCLDHLTNSKQAPNIINLQQPAGYGTSTLLMSLAVRLVEEKAGKVFYLKDGVGLNEGDVEFAINNTDGVGIFIIDNASKHKSRIDQLRHHYREKKQKLLIVIGSRKNEWQQLTPNKVGLEFNIDALSDNEINKLLKFLKEHSCLGELEQLDYDLQVAAIKDKLGKELLVVMREATEGLGFDAILESEYRGIQDDTAQTIYLTVCCFYQFGNLLRTGLLSSICEIDEVKLNEFINKYLEGIVLTDDINPDLGIYGVRPRHRKIAEIVWNRCGNQTLQEEILYKSLQKLNLNYRSDREAFENFIRADHLIDTISTFEGKTNFFETSCKKDPTNSYVWQHYARMLARSKKFELALSQIDQAIEIAPKRILYHTKGKILGEIACQTDSRDIGRKRLIQSEAVFKRGLNIKHNDEYCLHGLAELYFNWAKYIGDKDESNEYLAKAENQISEALKLTTNKEQLWILSSEIAKYIGNSPEHIKALENAINSSANAHKSRFLLGRTLRKSRRYTEACELLESAFKDNTGDFRIAIEYAKALLGCDEPNSKAIAILKLAELQGLKYPIFTTFLGGLYFLEKKYEEAKKVFNESKKQALSFQDRKKIYYNPSIKNECYYLTGKVVTVKTGYAFIEVTGYADNFYCPGSKWNKILLKDGMNVQCRLAFSADGPVLLAPQEVQKLL